MKNTDIKNVYYKGNEVSALYWGANPVYAKVVKPTYTANTLAGKYIENSGAPCWWYNLNGTQTSMSQYVDPTTKEFAFEFTDSLSDCNGFFSTNIYLEKIYHLPDTAKVTSMSYMFNNCNQLTSLNLSNLKTSNVTDMSYMFYGCSNIDSLDLSSFDTSNVTSTERMFNGCAKLTLLDLSSFDTSNVTSTERMFNGCAKLTLLDLSRFDTSNVTNMKYMFCGCSNIDSLDLSSFDTSNVTSTESMFEGCVKLTTLNFGDLDMSNVSATSGMFSNCTNLTTITGNISNIGKCGNYYYGISFNYSPLTHDSAMVFINGLATAPSGTVRYIWFRTSTYNTLTANEIAIATGKGWTVEIEDS